MHFAKAYPALLYFLPYIDHLGRKKPFHFPLGILTKLAFLGKKLILCLIESLIEFMTFFDNIDDVSKDFLEGVAWERIFKSRE